MSNAALLASLPDIGISVTWKLCDEFTVHQAALLAIGIDPASETGSNCIDWKPHERPMGYEGAKQGISAALRKGQVTGKNVETQDTDWNGNAIGDIPNTTEVNQSSVNRDSLVLWLKGRGITSGFFFPAEDESPDYMKPGPRYAPKLSAAVSAWQAVTDPKAQSPKQALMRWLREHASQFGLADDEGKPNETGIEEVAKVANWQPGGGATRTPGG